MAAIQQIIEKLKHHLRRLLVPHNLGYLFVWRQILRPRGCPEKHSISQPLPRFIPISSLPSDAYTEIFPTEKVVNQRPAGLPEWAWKQYWYKRRSQIGPYGVARLAGGRMHGTGIQVEVEIEAANGVFLSEISRETEDPLEGCWQPIEYVSDLQTRHLTGVTVVLAQVWADNYYHFRLQCLPRILLAQKLVVLDHVTHWIISPLRYEFQIKLLEAAGIPRDKLVLPQAGQVITADDMLIPSIPGEDRYVPEWAWRYSASLVTPDDTFPKHEKVYIKRGNAYFRRLVNEAQVVAFLQERGFACFSMDDLTLEQQAALFQNAHVIAGVHGAAFTNLIYAKPETKLVEIMPANYVDPCYERLATGLGIDHRVVVGREPHQPASRYRRVYRADTIISLSDMEKML